MVLGSLAWGYHGLEFLRLVFLWLGLSWFVFVWLSVIMVWKCWLGVIRVWGCYVLKFPGLDSFRVAQLWVSKSGAVWLVPARIWDYLAWGKYCWFGAS